MITPDPFAEVQPVRSAWMVTLADLALLLAGFLVLVQAVKPDDRVALAKSMRARFGEDVATATVAVQAGALSGFAPGSADASPAETARLADWAREELRDPRAALSIIGSTDGSATDRDTATGSSALLATDRARAAAAAILAVVPNARLAIAADPRPHGRTVQVTVALIGEEK